MQENNFYQLVTKYVMGSILPNELEILYALMQENEEYKNYFESFCSVNNIKLLDENNAFEGEQAYAALYVKMQMDDCFTLNNKTENEIVDDEESLIITPVRKRNWSKLILCSSLLVAIAIAGIYFWNGNYNNTTDWNYKNEIRTGKGNRSFVKLPDGSSVWLNSGSRLVYPKNFDIHQREVMLFGEAYFDIAKNKARPFIILAKNIKIRVLGTAFNVRAYANEKELETTLLRGSIEVYGANDDYKEDNTIRLQPGDKLKIFASANRKDAQASTILKYAKEKMIDRANLDTMWMNNKLVFNGDALSVVCTKLENWFNVKINIQNPNLKDEKFSGVFENPKLDFVMSALSQTGRFNYSLYQDSVNIQ